MNNKQITYPKDILHGKVIDFNEIKDQIPTRNKFLDKNTYTEVSNTIYNREPLIFMPNDVIEDAVTEKDNKFNDGQYTKKYYKIIITGICVDGRKIIVMMDGITPYCCIKIPENDTTSDTKANIKRILDKENIKYEKLITVDGKEFKYNSPAKYIKISFRILSYRRRALYQLSKIYKTAHDDGSDYFRVVARDYKKSFASWVVIKNYSHGSYGNKFYGKKIFKVNYKNYKPYTGIINKELQYDKLIELSWDIETYSMLEQGTIPSPNNESDNMFMVGIAVQWYYTPINTDINGDRILNILDGELLNIILTDTPTAATDNKLTIICHTERNIIKAMGYIFNKINPDFVSGFNDSSYDWNWFAVRAQKHTLLKFLENKMSIMDIRDSNINKVRTIDRYKYFKHHHIKHEADRYIDEYVLKYFGYITIDARTQMRLLYKTTGNIGNLKYFLAENKLGSKAEMSYSKLFRIYKYSKIIVPILKKARILLELGLLPKIIISIINLLSNENKDDNITIDEIASYEIIDKAIKKSAYDMSSVGEYCFVDALRCHELLKRRELIIQKRKFADITYTTIGDGFLYADGMKIRNLVISKGQDRGFYFSNQYKEAYKESYPGAYVGFPIKGMVKSKLSIDERIDTATSKITSNWTTFENKNTDYIDKTIYNIETNNINKHILWKYVSKTNICNMKKFIEHHGIHYNTLDEKSKEVLTNVLSDFDNTSYINNNIYDVDNKTYNVDHKLLYIKEAMSPDYIQCNSISSICLMEFLLEKNKYPVTSFDFKSLYPNIIITYNLSPEYLIRDRNQAINLIQQNKTLQRVSFKTNTQNIKVWFVRHDNNPDDMGLFPDILKEFQEHRDILKLPNTVYKYIYEVMSEQSINTMSLYELIDKTYCYINKRLPSDILISKTDIITKYLTLNMDDITRTNSI